MRSLSLKNGVKAASHFCPQLSRSRGVKESAISWSLPESLHRKNAFGMLLEIDAFGSHQIRKPVVLIEAPTCRKRKVGTHPHEHAAPMQVANVKVVMLDPASGQLQMPAPCCADRRHDSSRFPRLENDHDAIRFGLLEIGRNKIVTPALGCVKDGSSPF